MPAPEITVEIAWSDGHSEPNPTWTDVTEYVESVSPKMGRSEEIGAIEAATCNIVLNNKGGAFTPENPDSPFYPNVTPRRQVRVRVDDAPVPEMTPVLTNLVTNPTWRGDTAGWLIDSDPSKIDLTFTDSRGAPFMFWLFRGSNTAYPRIENNYRTAPGLDDVYPCSPGDRISLVNHVRTATLSGSGDWDVTYTAYIEWRNAAGAVVQTDTVATVTLPAISDNTGGDGRQEDSTPEEIMEWFYRLHAENVEAPAGLGVTGFRVQFGHTTSDNASAEGDQAVYSKRVAVYNHGPTPYTWPAYGTQYWGGDSPSSDEFVAGWTGFPDQSTTEVYRVSETAEGVLFRGVIETWPLDLEGGASTVTVQATDPLPVWTEGSLSPPFTYEIVRRSPRWLWRFNEGSDARTFYSSIDPLDTAHSALAYDTDGDLYDVEGNDPPYVHGGEPSLIPGLEEETSIRAMNQRAFISGLGGPNEKLYHIGAYVDIPMPVIKPATDSFTFSWVYKYNGEWSHEDIDAHSFTLFDSRKKNGGRNRISHYIERTTNNQYLMMKDADGNLHYQFLGDGDPYDAHFYAISWDAETETFRISYKGFDDVNPADSGNASFELYLPDSRMRFDRINLLGLNTGNAINGFADHQIQYLAGWDRALTLGEIDEILANFEARQGETADSRIGHVLDQLRWPLAMRRLDTSSTQVARATWQEGARGLDMLREPAEDAKGLLYADRDGAARFEGRDARPKAGVSWVFDHDAGTGVESGLRLEMSVDDIINVADIDNAFGVKANVRNEDSVNLYGERSKPLELRLVDQDEAIQYGYHIVNRYKDPIIRIDSVSFYPSAHADGALWDAALGVKISDKVTLAGLPDDAPVESMTFFVESVEHNISRNGEALDWFVTLNLSPAHLSAGWILGDPVAGVLGETTVPHF